MAPSKKQYDKRKSHVAGANDGANLLSEAEKIRQQAERKPEGQSREALLSRSVELLQKALSSTLSPQQQQEALFDLAEIYGLWANSTRASMYPKMGNIFNGKLNRRKALELHNDALRRAIDLHRKSHEAYEKVITGISNELKLGALVNCGNTLCDWAELSLELLTDNEDIKSAAADLLNEADIRYSAALSISQDDVELLSNYGDCYVARAELATRVLSNDPVYSNAWMTAKEFYSRADALYGRACSLSDASVGDDLAGLVQNWGACLVSLCERTPDPLEAANAYEQALEKFRTAAKFRPTDVSVFIAIGEACCSRAEKLENTPQSLELLHCAVEEGFGTALRINSSCLDAIIGKAEAHAAAGKFTRNAQMFSTAEEHFIQSLKLYTTAVQILKSDSQNECRMNFEDQCDLLYNFACVASVCKNEATCSEALNLLLQVGGITTTYLAEDPDLEPVRNKEWFLQIIQQANSSQ